MYCLERDELLFQWGSDLLIITQLGFVDGNAQDVILNAHTNDTLPFSPTLNLLPQPPLQIQQQPSGNMDDSGFFSIQVSSHKHVPVLFISQAVNSGYAFHSLSKLPVDVTFRSSSSRLSIRV